jgi:diguanylate cyclase
LAEDHIIQLHLENLGEAGRLKLQAQATWLIDQLLEIILEDLSDEDTGSDGFQSRLENLRHSIRTLDGSQLANQTAMATLELCRGQLKKVNFKRLERDTNFMEIIELLRETLVSLTTDSKEFNENLLGTTGRLKEIAGLRDVKELKSRITAEVNELTRAVEERQRREQSQYARLSSHVMNLQKKLEQAKTEASLDGLTGIANRRSFDYTIKRWVSAHEKSEEPFTIALFDLDNFKAINDNYGHQVGDQVLIAIALEIGKNIRASDFLARYGGEEFVVLTSGMKLAGSQNRFTTLVQHIEKMKFDCKSEEKGLMSVSLTCSCGIAEYALGENSNDLIRRADEAMYDAKRAGKNQVAVKRRPLLSAFYEGRKRNPLAFAK